MTQNARESDEHCCERALLFLEWLNKRPEKCIAVVTHSSFLRHIFSQFGGNLAADDKDSLQRLAGNWCARASNRWGERCCVESCGFVRS